MRLMNGDHVEIDIIEVTVKFFCGKICFIESSNSFNIHKFLPLWLQPKQMETELIRYTEL